VARRFVGSFRRFAGPASAIGTLTINERLPTLPFVLHDLEPYLLAAAHLVQILQPVALLGQVLIAHCPSDIQHRYTPSDPRSFGSVYPRQGTPPQPGRHSIAVKLAPLKFETVGREVNSCRGERFG